MSKPGIFRVSRPNPQNVDYDEFDSFIIACRDVFVARRTHPRSTPERVEQGWALNWHAGHEAWVDGTNAPYMYHGWTTDIDYLIVERLGDAAPGVAGVLIASFNAG